MRALWLPAVLRLAGLDVITYPGWESRSNGDFDRLRALVWHHDASPRGDSPGVPSYMIRNYRNAGAQLWVDRRGTWHVIASGVAYHAGKVMSGKPGNWDSLGVETDHTTNEPWEPGQLDSLRKGTAAILRHLGLGPTGLEFHRTVCSPPGRKSDPDGLDLVAERIRVGALIHGAAAIPAQENDMRSYYVMKIEDDGKGMLAIPDIRFDHTNAVTPKANDDGGLARATIQPFEGYGGLLALAAEGAPGLVGVIVSHTA